MSELRLGYDELDYFEECRGAWECLARAKRCCENRLGGYRAMQAPGHCERCNRATVPGSSAEATHDMIALEAPVPEQRDHTCDEAWPMAIRVALETAARNRIYPYRCNIFHGGPDVPRGNVTRSRQK